MRGLVSPAMVACVAGLAACSSGSGSSGGGAAQISFDRDEVAFTTVEQSEPPPYQRVTVTASAGAAFAVVGYAPGTAQPSWLDADLFATGNGTTWTLFLFVRDTALAPGAHQTTLRVVTERQDRSVIATRDLRVTLTVTTGVAAVPSSVLTLEAVAGSSVSPGSRPIHVVGTAGTAWTASSDRTWASLSKTSGTVPEDIAVTVDPSGLAPGSDQARVTIVGGGTSATVLVPVTLTAPLLTVAPTSIALGGAAGHDLSARSAQIGLGTGTHAYAWTASSPDDWLEIAPASGTVSGSGTAIALGPSSARLAGGLYESTVTVTTVVAGETLTRTIPVTLTLDEHRLLVSRTGVAFTATPGSSALTAAVGVRSNRGLAVAWSATSDRSWLSVTPSGSTPDALVLTASASGLAADALHEATVSVTSDDAGIANVERVRVGLWVASAEPAAATTVPGTYAHVAADPVRPRLYVSGGGTSITVVHALTGATVATFAAVGEKLGAMAVSGDGERLFAIDEGATPRIVPVELPSGAVGAAWPISTPVTGPGRLAYARSSGVGLVLVGDGSIRDATTGTAYATQGVGDRVAASRDGSTICGINIEHTPGVTSCRTLDVNGTAGAVAVGPSRSASEGSPGRDVALSSDGARAYGVAGAFHVYDPHAVTAGADMVELGLLLPSQAYPVAIEVGPDDRVYGATWSFYENRVFFYGADGTARGSSELGAETVAAGLAVAGDGMRLAVLTAPALRILAVP